MFLLSFFLLSLVLFMVAIRTYQSFISEYPLVLKDNYNKNTFFPLLLPPTIGSNKGKLPNSSLISRYNIILERQQIIKDGVA